VNTQKDSDKEKFFSHYSDEKKNRFTIMNKDHLFNYIQFHMYDHENSEKKLKILDLLKKVLSLQDATLEKLYNKPAFVKNSNISL